MLKLILLSLAIIMPAVAQAELYKVINAYGEITFTDTKPSIDAKEHIPGRVSAVKNEAFNMEKIKAKKKAQEKAERKAAKNSKNRDR